jgi:hypothetical protein
MDIDLCDLFCLKGGYAVNAKKIVTLVVIVFLGFWMFTDPSGLAVNAKDAAGYSWSLATDLFDGVINFIKQL